LFAQAFAARYVFGFRNEQAQSTCQQRAKFAFPRTPRKRLFRSIGRAEGRGSPGRGLRKQAWLGDWIRVGGFSGSTQAILLAER
jgi:hypothetical protein